MLQGPISLSIHMSIISNDVDLQDNSITTKVLKFWTNRRESLINDYSLVGYLLSPHPTIMEDAAKNKTQEHLDAALRLITTSEVVMGHIESIIILICYVVIHKCSITIFSCPLQHLLVCFCPFLEMPKVTSTVNVRKPCYLMICNS